jgi:zinc/manganese transport system substrate-binding protein
MVVARRRSCVACLLAVLALVASCSSTSAPTDGRLGIVASTDVYGDIAHVIAGRYADITTFIDNPAQDPHSYEANARNELAISKADVVIENGGGYDDFVDQMRAASGAHAGTLINVVDLSGKAASSGADLNEHVWYDFGTVAKLALRLSSVLGRRDHPHAALFAHNAAAFINRLHGLENIERSIRAKYASRGVAITEPVPLYLLQACGLVNKTPAAFSDAVENGTGVAAGVLKKTLDLFASGSVHALVYNAQTSGPETTQVLDAARAHHVPTVAVTETLPAGTTYLSWMRANLAALRSALAA